jgi:hypothetical protein
VHDDSPAPTPEAIDAVVRSIDAWAQRELVENPAVLAVDRGEPAERRWYIRLAGEDKDFITVWLSLGQRTLHYETYVLPAPEDAHAEVFDQLLRRNRGLHGLAFVIGPEDAIYLEGRLALEAVDDAALDRIVGSLYSTVEQCFRPLLRLAFASRFTS